MSYNLTREQEYSYITKAQAGDKRAANEFVAMHVAFVKWIIVKRFGSRDDHDMDDLIAWGMVGIVKALERFDVKRGFRFSTLAGDWVFQYVARALREMTGLSKNSDEDKIYRHREKVVARLFSGEPANDIGKEYGLSGERVEAFARKTTPKVSIFAMNDRSPYVSGRIKIRDASFLSVNIEDELLDREDNRRLWSVVNDELSKMPARSRKIIERYANGETFLQIAKSMKISRQRVQYTYHREFEALKKRANKRVKQAA